MNKHYKNLKIEPLQYIQANGMDFIEGNIIKYVSRYKYKDTSLQDLEKAKYYLDLLIEKEADCIVKDILKKTEGRIVSPFEFTE